MTDFQAPSLGPTSQFDASGLDANIQSISAVEKTWRAPALPDEAKLDLAMMPGVTPQGLTAFLQGLDSDISGEAVVEEEEPQAPAPYQVSLQDDKFGTSGMDLARRVFADVANEPAPTDPTQDAVKRFKMRAIEKGFIDAPDGVVDNTWSPELNDIRHQMAFQDYDESMRGDRYGAMDARNVLDIVGQWTQPTQLLAAATELDLWWDTGAISKEFSSWGDKFRKLQDSGSPWDYAKNLVDALTGPIDDVVVPIVNWGLIASGVSGVYGGARIAGMAAKLGRGGAWIEDLYSANKLRSAANIASIAEPSWTATKLLKSENEVVKGLGGLMKGWREFAPVSKTKQFTQAGMRLGFASQAENMIPGYQGGIDLAGKEGERTVLGAQADRLRTMGLNPITMPLELALAPYNIFSPGTFVGRSGAISKTGSGLYKVAGTVGGRAAIGGLAGAGVGALAGDDVGDIAEGAAVGAAALASAPTIGRGISKIGDGILDASTFRYTPKAVNGVGKFVGHVGDFLETMSFVPLADDQRTANAFDRVMRRVLEGDDLKRYEAAWSEPGTTLSKAVGTWAGMDEEAGGALVTWMMMSAAIDSKAAGFAKLVENGSFQTRFHNFRDQFIGQLRTFDVSDLTQYNLEDIVTAAALGAAGDRSPKAFNKVWQDIYNAHVNDPSKLFELATTHNANAERTLRELSDGVDEETLYKYMGQTLDSFGRWDQFTSADAQITEALHSGLFDPAEYMPVVNRKGNQSAFRGGAPKRTSSTQIIDNGIHGVLTTPADQLDPRVVTNENLALLTGSTGPAGRMTVARVGTASGQDLTSTAGTLQRLLDVAEGLRGAKVAKVDWRAVEQAAGGALDSLDEAALQAALTAVTGKTKYSSTLKSVIDLAQERGITPIELIDQFDNHINQIANSSDLFTGLGLASQVSDKDGKILYGVKALKRRVRDLNHQAHFTAAEIDVPKLIAHYESIGDVEAAQRVKDLAEGLAADGYKLVHGKEFVMPHDLNQNFKPFRDMTTRHLHAETMGNFFRRRLPAEAALIQDRRNKLSMAKQLGRALGKDINANDAQVHDVLTDLRRIMDNLQGDAAGNIDKLWQQSWINRRLTGIETSHTPIQLPDLTKRQKEVVEGLVGLGHDRDIAEAAWAAVPEMRQTAFKDVGLYGVEAWLRSHNQGAQFLSFATGQNTGGLINGRNAYRATGAYMGWQGGNYVGQSIDDTDPNVALGGGIVGAALGAVGGNYAAKGMSSLANADGALAGKLGLAKKGAESIREAPNAEFPVDTITQGNRSLMRRVQMNQKGYMAESLVRMRDSLRFTLSPFFDISRYTEGLMLAQTAAPSRGLNGERLALHLNMSPTALRRRYIKDALQGLNPSEATAKAHQWFDEERALFRQAARGNFDPEVLDSTGKWFSQIGIAGFNPTDWMTSAFIELRHVGGLDSETAYRAVKEMYTYGTSGRSAAELSTNFIFFPFSFQKKALTHLGKWMNDDLGRSILIHDAMKTYEILDQKYDLNEYWRDHAPMLQQLNKLNLFAFGISPGRLGGINRPFFEAAYKGGQNYAMALFTPHGASIRDAAEAAELQKVVHSLTPALNDINWMKEAVKQQSNVLLSDSHVTIDQEVRQGYDEWNAYKQEMSDTLDRHGYTWSDLYNKPFLSKEYAQYKLTRAELAAKYPAWSDSRTKVVGNRIALEMEKEQRLSRANGDPANASVADLQLNQMETLLSGLKEQGSIHGLNLGGSEGWEDAPPALFDYVHKAALDLLARDPKFNGLWTKYYAKDFGPLEAQI